MAEQRSFRDRLVEFLATQTEERDEMLARLTRDERRAYSYQCYQVPVMGRIDPNSLGKPPFDEREMRQHLNSALSKICFWIVERLQADRPTTLAPLPPGSN